jgi:hypothetical protein
MTIQLCIEHDIDLMHLNHGTLESESNLATRNLRLITYSVEKKKDAMAHLLANISNKE